MSSALVSTSAALGRPFVFDSEEGVAEACPQPSGAELFAEARPPQRVVPGIFRDNEDACSALLRPRGWKCVLCQKWSSSGIAAMDALTGGLPRGCLTEICGPASSGRTTLLLAALAAATRRGEFCAGRGCQRCSRSAVRSPRQGSSWTGCCGCAAGKILQAEHCLEHLLRAADLLLESGGFGLIALDLGDLPPQMARRIPLTTWFRFPPRRGAYAHCAARNRAAVHRRKLLFVIDQAGAAGTFE